MPEFVVGAVVGAVTGAAAAAVRPGLMAGIEDRRRRRQERPADPRLDATVGAGFRALLLSDPDAWSRGDVVPMVFVLPEAFDGDPEDREAVEAAAVARQELIGCTSATADLAFEAKERRSIDAVDPVWDLGPDDKWGMVDRIAVSLGPTLVVVVRDQTGPWNLWGPSVYSVTWPATGIVAIEYTYEELGRGGT